jgi:hypothetical protein
MQLDAKREVWCQPSKSHSHLFEGENSADYSNGNSAPLYVHELEIPKT